MVGWEELFQPWALPFPAYSSGHLEEMCVHLWKPLDHPSSLWGYTSNPRTRSTGAFPGGTGPIECEVLGSQAPEHVLKGGNHGLWVNTFPCVPIHSAQCGKVEPEEGLLAHTVRHLHPVLRVLSRKISDEEQKPVAWNSSLLYNWSRRGEGRSRRRSSWDGRKLMWFPSLSLGFLSNR